MEKLVLRSSRGGAIATGDRVFVRYEGRLLNGSQFDRNFRFDDFQAEDGRDLFSFVIGSGEVIQGWEQGLSNSRLGEVIQLVIPPELAYGQVARPGIPPDSTLEFKIEIVGLSRGDRTVPITYTLNDIGIDIEDFGFTNKDLARVSSSKIGLDGNDAIAGSGERDFITGLGVNNQIIGGLAGDILLSAKGIDTFGYTQQADSLPGKSRRDVIGGFSSEDKIDLSQLGSDFELVFVGKKRFSRSPGEVRYQAGLLSVDLTGDGRSDFEIELTNKPMIRVSNLLLQD